ncbi:MAG: hypothetical protein ACQEQK_04305 [Thermodesulfobacteriota bacterium]
MNLNISFSNRPVRTRMPGDVAGAQLNAAPYADQPQLHLGVDTHPLIAV